MPRSRRTVEATLGFGEEVPETLSNLRALYGVAEILAEKFTDLILESEAGESISSPAAGSCH